MYSYMKEKHPGRLWMAQLQMDHWDDICTAHERGKKLILTSTNTPAELIYAFDAVPFVPETLIMRYAGSDKTFKYLDLADQYVSHQLCSINRGQIGYYLSGDLKMKPDAILATVTPCDSSRVAYTAAADILGIPSFTLDTPYRQDERGYRYLGEQIKEACKFLEKVTGNKLDWDKFREIIDRGNQAARLLTACSRLRQITPCPLPGSLLVLNEMVDRMIGEYKVNVSMFAGHVGCKHTWAASKLVKDYIYEKYGLPTLTFDEDGIDIRYQTADQIKAVITEYMETLIEIRGRLT